jgi:ubiquinone/menaquinone biosynthesis C-methylase UbiE
MTTNEQWARNIIEKTDPDCRPRWEIFDSLITELGDSNQRCLNVGAGTKEEFDLAELFKSAIDTDVLYPENVKDRNVPFIQSDIINLPFKDKSIDLLLLRFVVEHLSDPEEAFHEINRILSPGGKVLIVTTNLSSPIIFLPKIFLPYSIRKWLLKIIFRAQDDDIFPTYHRINTKRAYRKLSHILSLKDLIYIQDINWTHKWLFLLFYTFHLKTKFFHLKFLRSNIITILQKV